GRADTARARRPSRGRRRLRAGATGTYEVFAPDEQQRTRRSGQRARSGDVQQVAAAWREMRAMLAYKCEWYGRDLVVTGRWYPSSTTCSARGEVNYAHTRGCPR